MIQIKRQIKKRKRKLKRMRLNPTPMIKRVKTIKRSYRLFYMSLMLMVEELIKTSALTNLKCNKFMIVLVATSQNNNAEKLYF